MNKRQAKKSFKKRYEKKYGKGRITLSEEAINFLEKTVR
jgi:hypothetical protein